ncbi:CPBP family intramembrane glutamic endopeptidase [Actinomadura sp. SCN-SB]|uniref:CPBP family intramembrane glutamic endopeptidase n=1 Tax=Actinomadura sp. SCN-SB TaxID=3373092 RepID=UPI00375272B2
MPDSSSTVPHQLTAHGDQQPRQPAGLTDRPQGPPLPPHRSWRLREAIVALLGQLVLGQIILVLLAVAGAPIGTDPAGLITAALANIVALLMVVAGLARARRRRPRAALGLRPVSLPQLVLWPAAWLGIYWAFALPYTALVDPPAQTVENSVAIAHGAALITLTVVGVCLAPWAEEMFWRGLVYRALRGHCRALIAAPITALPFAALHLDPTGTADQLLLLPLLVVGAVMACVMVEQTGSLLPGMVFHAGFNAIGFAIHGDPVTAAAAWAIMAAVCLIPMIRARPATADNGREP